MKTLKYLFNSYVELFRESVRKHVYMRKLHFTIKTGRQLNAETGRKYYVLNGMDGNPTLVTRQMINELKLKGVLPKDFTHVDLENQAIHVIM